MKNYYQIIVIFISWIFVFTACENKNEEIVGSIYDPSKPVELTTFYPDSGRYQEKVLLTGTNFGSDPSVIKVYFNSKRAPVIGSTGSRIYVTAPRLPGDTCTISVVVGKDSVSYENMFFKYKTSITVTNVAGNGVKDYKDGDLTTATLRAQWIAIDEDDNIFVCHWPEGDVQPHNVLARINEETNELVTIQHGITANIPTVDQNTGRVVFSTQNSVGEYVTLNPLDFWAPKYYQARWTNPSETPPNPFNPASVSNPADGYIYTHFFNTGVMKINPDTWEAELIYPLSGAVNGMTFRANEPNILYIMMRATSSYLPNTLITIDVTDPIDTFQRLTNITASGFRDGDLNQAQFNDVRMIVSDHDGNIYMADSNNHCIRRLTPQNMVETVLGIPGTPGWRDGSREEALFNAPTGIAVMSDGTVYVADHGNSRVRKLSIN